MITAFHSPLYYLTLLRYPVFIALLLVIYLSVSLVMAKVLTINTADTMASTLDFPIEPFPTFEDPFPVIEPFPTFEDFPVYDCPIAVMADPGSSPSNKLLEKIVNPTLSDRKPSPQPTHFSVPYKYSNGNGHRVLRSATVGYVAPEFKGKKEQMLQGRLVRCRVEYLI